MSEEKLKELVKDYKAGVTVAELSVKYNWKSYSIVSFIAKLRKAGANIPKKKYKVDYKKLASEINAGE